jgi:hypothetical protein
MSDIRRTREIKDRNKINRYVERIRSSKRVGKEKK